MPLSHTLSLPSPATSLSRKRSIGALSEADGSSPILSSRKLRRGVSPASSPRTWRRDSYTTLSNLPQTPPDSTAGSPALKASDFASATPPSPPHSPLAPIVQSPTTATKQFIESLPSIVDFDQQVQEWISKYGPAPPPSRVSVNDMRPAVTFSETSQRSPRRTFAPTARYSDFPSSPFLYQPTSEYPVPLSPDAEGRHINQKYTTEQGDYIIYAWHDKKMKWADIKEEYASMFGRTPVRTVQGLQAWYYRMNKEIPVWDDDGWLMFDNDDALEPKYIVIKRREKDLKCDSCLSTQGSNKLKKDQDGIWREEGCQCKQLPSLGLAQRYPERAIHYPWVDPELKRKARNWAEKRTMQYSERRERRQRKEMRRVKL